MGDAIRRCDVPREELFITTKVWISNAGYKKAKASLQESRRKLQTEYIDLVLIHQPFNDYYGTYRAMEEAYKEEGFGLSVCRISIRTGLLTFANLQR